MNSSNPTPGVLPERYQAARQYSRKCSMANCARVWLCLLVLGVWLLPGQAWLHADQSQGQPKLPTMQIMIGDKRLTVEIAATPAQRYAGLSFRRSLAEDEGMLFVFENERALTFTMRNTLIPLSIAFISSDLVINEIHTMNVGPGQYFPSDTEAQYALEVNQGWFRENGIEPGDRVIWR